MSDQQELSLTIGDKINYPFIIANILLKIQEVLIKPEGMQSEQQVRESVLTLYNSIPSSWYTEDNQFTDDIEKAVIVTKVDTRVLWCGVRCGSLEDHPPREETTVAPYRMYHACIDLLDRRGTLSKKMWKQIDPFIKWVEERDGNNKSEIP